MPQCLFGGFDQAVGGNRFIAFAVLFQDVADAFGARQQAGGAWAASESVQRADAALDINQVIAAERQYRLAGFAADALFAVVAVEALQDVLAYGGDVYWRAQRGVVLRGAFVEPCGERQRQFVLRYQADEADISLIRLITENELALPLAAWLDKSAAQYDAALGAPIHVAAVREYILERLDSHYREQGIRSETCQAVLALGSDDLVDIERRIRALDAFAGSPSATSLLASAKRIRNILKKNGERNEAVAADRLVEPAEQALWQNWQTLAPAIDAELQKSDYRAALEQLATLGAPLDAFFTDVMVMSDDPALQQNRLALLTTLQRGFDQIADLSLLSE